jgi:F-type H+-transporting ATPase subunit delta
MLELTRGYAAALLDEAQADGGLDAVVSGLAALTSQLVGSEALRNVLADSAIAGELRAAIFADLFTGKVDGRVVALATFAITYERAGELPKVYEQLFELAEARVDLAASGALLPGEPPIGRAGALERIRGYAEQVFERVSSQDAVDGIEDELFRLARFAEQSRELRQGLAAPDTPLPVRLAVIDELLSGKVRPETIGFAGFILRAGRGRDIVGALDYLVELAAAERGRRVAEIHAAVELLPDEAERLAAALSARTRRTVELRVIVDPSVLGGLDIAVGDTVIDGTVRHRLEQLRDTLLQPS